MYCRHWLDSDFNRIEDAINDLTTLGFRHSANGMHETGAIYLCEHFHSPQRLSMHLCWKLLFRYKWTYKCDTRGLEGRCGRRERLLFYWFRRNAMYLYLWVEQIRSTESFICSYGAVLTHVRTTKVNGESSGVRKFAKSQRRLGRWIKEKHLLVRAFEVVAKHRGQSWKYGWTKINQMHFIKAIVFGVIQSQKRGSVARE